MGNSLWFDAFVYLTAAIVSVPIATRLGLGSVLGYLIAGCLIGPYALRLVGGSPDVMHFAEFGVVIMLFLIGLELKPSRLWRLKSSIFFTGGLQVVLTVALIWGIAHVFAMSDRQALALGLILSVSSTALVLQSLQEKGLMKTPAGKHSFSVLLFQDIAVIPMLAILPFLAMKSGASALASSTPAWVTASQMALVIIGIIFGGHYLLRPVFRMVAQSNMRELFVAASLALVVGIAQAMDMVGLSPALGTFLAGVVLADSEYRHELEADVEPFKGLLLGLFFISVGANINFVLLWDKLGLIVSLVVALVAVKFAVLWVVGKLSRLRGEDLGVFSTALSQSGEFGFVLVSFAGSSLVLNTAMVDLVTLVIALSMATTPLLLMLCQWWLFPRLRERAAINSPSPAIDDNENPVIIAGFGRFGQIVGRVLHNNHIGMTILEHDANHIKTLGRFGFKVFYGNATRADLLSSAGAEQAKLLVVAVDSAEQTLEIVQMARKNFPQLIILARAVDREHALELMRAGVDYVHRETLGSGVAMAVDALTELGWRANQAYRIGEFFKSYDSKLLREQLLKDDQNTEFLRHSLRSRKMLDQLLDDDSRLPTSAYERAWESNVQKSEQGADSSRLKQAHRWNKQSKQVSPKVPDHQVGDDSSSK
ncbi:monovalent cation:proton antiporter-2 (CPA2) family protein [Celerinatantimonas yamalensis]|uniref:Monovalent cation:proton antiporter-2 (CPA2) family protein n=1 Tax=Celerinatantimonas yamalensis TaxID=559956 RepID=A0ABW9GA50_9GAMM